ncbi:hypothetical protein H5410_002745 [Solanum commersonii]|uniref:Uncharacterized protein n=1 Tax=Solanum commersonii TaxID=4109 RepID=A0A9J6B317_SOLCO|nr:hypothetical protein H5410_002745 [Solanum commersonii]
MNRRLLSASRICRPKVTTQITINAPNPQWGGNIRRTAKSFSELDLARQSFQRCLFSTRLLEFQSRNPLRSNQSMHS